MSHEVEIFQARRFQQALDQLLQVDAGALFDGVHRLNEILAENGIPNPMSEKAILELGIAIGAIHVLQETAPGK